MHDNGTVRCLGDDAQGRLGYGTAGNVGDHETPGSVAPVELGAGRTAVAISGESSHTCALLDNGAVRCWGFGFFFGSSLEKKGTLGSRRFGLRDI